MNGICSAHRRSAPLRLAARAVLSVWLVLAGWALQADPAAAAAAGRTTELMTATAAKEVAKDAANETAQHKAPETESCPPWVLPLSSANTDPVAPSRDLGLLWQISRGGRVSHLYGTLHVGRPGWMQPGPALRRALVASDVLALEIDPDDPQLAAAFTPVGPPPVLPPSLQQRLQLAFGRACLSRAALSSLHPVLQATTLAVLEARWLGLDAQYAQERALSALAAERQLPVVSLETAAQQVALLLPADPAEAEASLASLLTQLEDGSGRRVLQRLASAWEQGDLATLADFQQWCECAATDEESEFMRNLNDRRNGPMADRIAALHAGGQRVLVAVGALHMTGPQSLPRLLAERGFEVRRVSFDR